MLITQLLSFTLWLTHVRIGLCIHAEAGFRGLQSLPLYLAWGGLLLAMAGDGIHARLLPNLGPVLRCSCLRFDSSDDKLKHGDLDPALAVSWPPRATILISFLIVMISIVPGTLLLAPGPVSVAVWRCCCCYHVSCLPLHQPAEHCSPPCYH